ncbi:hypothetical protein H8I69_02175 [Serratia fonticola]|uniref:hypothetical protein n=1 Tax=Serratia fonticola TaxID=47917 RepID=UPI0015C5E1EC|nr:hypothetical protein [Serratia fonticola]MBC3377926.1 hypothetical protein [Serratia fonticola]NYA37126.1 hypothetical protein [Serratia fonticola]
MRKSQPNAFTTYHVRHADIIALSSKASQAEVLSLAINKLIQLNAMEDCEIQILLDAQEDITTEIRSGLDNIIEGASHA